MLHKENRFSSRFQRFFQKTSSRKGSLLLLVVIILAVAMILITSALLITVQARNRYYGSALSSQANLTATSVAKTIATAVINGDINDAGIEALALAGESVKLPITSSSTATAGSGSAGNNSVAPGLAGVPGSSYTTAAFSYYPSNAIKTYIKISVATLLDAGAGTTASTDVVNVYLKKVVTGDPGAFINQVTVGPGSINFNNVEVGVIPSGVTPVNSAIVTHGNVTFASGGGNTFYSDVIITGQAKFNAGINFKKNLIFYDTGSISSDYGSGVNVTGHLLFIGKDATQTPIFTSPSDPTVGSPVTGTGGTTIGGGMYIINKLFASGTSYLLINPTQKTIFDKNAKGTFDKSYLYSDVKNNYFRADSTATLDVVSNPTITDLYTPATKPIITTLRNLVATDYSNAILSAKTGRKIMSTADAYLKLLGLAAADSKLGTDIAAAAGAKPLAALSIGGAPAFNALQVNTTTTLSVSNGGGSNYYIDTNSTQAATNRRLGAASGCALSGYSKIVFDLSAGPITLYIIDSKAGENGIFTIGMGLIQFINGDTAAGKIGKIILLDKTDVTLTNSDNGMTLDTGIIGSKHTIVAGGRTTVDTLGVAMPFLFIYGFEENIITVCRYTSIEGYIGLYGTAGKIKFDNTTYAKGSIYARFEGSGFENNGGDPARITYCPMPASSGGGSPTSSSYLIMGYINGV